MFPIDRETLRYLQLTGRSIEQLQLVEAYAHQLHLWREDGARQADYSAVIELDLAQVEPSLAGPKRPQDRVPLRIAQQAYQTSFALMAAERKQKNPTATGSASVTVNQQQFTVKDGDVLIAAITSCTNTSNPAVMLAAGLLARKARQRGITSKPWVKTSLAPGSRVVTDYLTKAKLLDDLDAIGFYTVGYGCTTCIGNSGPLLPEISAAVKQADVVGCAVLSGNRNFEGRVHPEIKMNFLASPPW
jgi:aconitate hydratase